MESYLHFIDGRWVPSETGKTLPVINPATEETIAQVPEGGRGDARQALEAANRAQPFWEDLDPIKRARYLHDTARLILSEKERLAQLITLEQGKPLYEAYLEIEGAAENFTYYAEFARRIEGDLLPADKAHSLVMILKLPLGVVVAITPWNFPSATVARKVAPALITGNTVVIKPSSKTPLSAIELVKLMERAGLPRGVVNVVTGGGGTVGEELVSNPLTSLISMTGSTPIGQKIMKMASGNITKLILELGGKAPFLVWSDADLEWAVKNAVWARFWNGGQTCICAERMYLHEEIADKFIKKFVDATTRLRLSDPLKAGVDLGPRVSREELEKGETFVKKTLDQGGRLLTGGRRPEAFKRGFWYLPTIIDNVQQDMDIVQEEVFGAIVPLMRVKNFDEVIQLCNDSKYGLASYIFTGNLKLAMKAAYKIKFGETYINQVGPEAFQGAHTGFRSSGLGAEGSRYGLEQYTQLKTVYIDYSDEPKTDYLMPYPDR